MGAIEAQILDELGYDPARPEVREIDFVPIGALVAARDGARHVAVARLASGQLVVVDDECPHDGGRISDGFVEGDRIVCARHNWELVPCEGRCIRASSGRGPRPEAQSP